VQCLAEQDGRPKSLTTACRCTVHFDSACAYAVGKPVVATLFRLKGLCYVILQPFREEFGDI